MEKLIKNQVDPEQEIEQIELKPTFQRKYVPTTCNVYDILIIG